MKQLLFAIDHNTEEVIVSDSPEGSTKIHFIERIGRKENEILYTAVVTLTNISKAASYNPGTFEAMDKVCQMLYKQHKQNK